MKSLSKGFLTIFIMTQVAYGQINPGPVVAGVESDINYLATGFLEPLGDAIASGINMGWQQGAVVDAAGSFSVSLVTNAVIVPNSRTTFTILQSKLTELELVNPNDNVTPTAFGEREPGVELEYKNKSLPLGLGDTRFNMPAGYGFRILPMGTAQATVSIFKNTAISIRFLPLSDVPYFTDTRINSFGLGLKHNLWQWFPNLKDAPVQVAAFVGYNNFNFEQDIEAGQGENQMLAINATAWTYAALFSTEFSFLTIYGSLGYNRGSSTVQMLGTYTYVNPLNVSDPEQELKDPIDFTTTGASSLAANLGLKVDIFKLIFISADYTLSRFSGLSVNLGFNVEL